MNNEKKETTTFKKILKGLGIVILVAGTGLAIYDHKEWIGTKCKSISNKLFNKNVKGGSKPNINYNPRRSSIRRN